MRIFCNLVLSIATIAGAQVAALRGHGIVIEDEALAHLSPIGWGHVNLTGDYTWQAAGRLRKGKFRPFGPSQLSMNNRSSLSYDF